MSIGADGSDRPFLDPEDPSAKDSAFAIHQEQKSGFSLKEAEGGELVAARSSEADGKNESDLAKTLEQVLHGIRLLEKLNLSEFRQIYPVFLALMWSVLIGSTLAAGISCLNSINNIPIMGGILGNIFELTGGAVIVRFAVSKLFLHRTRAELFARIAMVKKDLLS